MLKPKTKTTTAEVEVSRFIEKFWRQLFILLGVLVVSYGAFLGYGAYAEHREREAQESLFAIQKASEEIAKKITTEQEAATGKLNTDKKAKAPVTAPPVEKSPAALMKNYGDVIARYEKFIAEHKGSNASYMAAVQLAGLAVEHKDVPRAEKVLADLAPKKNDGVFFGLVKSQLGSVLMDQKKFAEAAQHFQALVDSKDQSYFHPQALLRLGVCHLEAGDFAKAEAAFVKLETDFSTTQAAQEAKSLKRLVAFKKGLKGNS